jgi:hypothetical protein
VVYVRRPWDASPSALQDLFNPRSLIGRPRTPCQCLASARGGCGHKAPRPVLSRRRVVYKGGRESSRRIHIPHPLPFCINPSRPFPCLLATACYNGVQTPSLPLPHTSRPHGAKAGAWMAGAGVRGLAALRCRLALEPLALM